MAEVTLSEAAARFTVSLADEARASAQVEINRFVRWYGASRSLSGLRGHDVSLYADVLGAATAEASRRADQVRAFLAYLKKEGLLTVNLAPHLRLRKVSKAGRGVEAPQQAPVGLTSEGIEALRTDMESLMVQRLEVRKEIRRAMLDKDFRENAPLDAAKERQGHIEARIREIEGMLKRAVVVASGAAQGGRVQVGSTVAVKNLGTGALMRYTIVGPTEASAANGKISSFSPVGKALLERGAGDEVEVSAPAGVLRLRIEQVEG